MSNPITYHECPKCGCRKLRLLNEEVLRHQIQVPAKDGTILTFDGPLCTVDMKLQRLEPLRLPAVCNCEDCGKDEDGVPHPWEAWVTVNAQKGTIRIGERKQAPGSFRARGRHRKGYKKRR